MLKNIDPLLCPDLLHALRAMGHGDEIAIVDANYPALASARRLVRQDGVDAVTMTDVVLSVMPLENSPATPAWRMEAHGDAQKRVPVFDAFDTSLAQNSATPALGSLERFAFYERVGRAFIVVVTGDRRHYANIILTKGALPES